MSRIGKKPIPLPSGVKIQVGEQLEVTGPKGKLTVPIPAGITFEQTAGKALPVLRGLVVDAPEKSTDFPCVRRSTLVWAIETVTADDSIQPSSMTRMCIMIAARDNEKPPRPLFDCTNAVHP